MSTNAAAWPFSFVYDQRPSSEFLPAWTCERTGQTAGAGRAQSKLTFRDPASGLRGRCEITEFVGHAALEWVLHFENRGPRDTSLLEAIRALDIRLPAGTNAPTLRYARGATCSLDDFQPLTEIGCVEGLYAFWDELLRRHPHLLIDNCASGGRRIDLETMSRSVPLWRTDFPGDPLGKQCHTYGLSFWVPLNGTGAVNPAHDSDYALRSSLSSALE